MLLVVYDDQTLIKARKRSPLDRGLLAKALRNLDAMGAKAIGIDILFDQPQDEDDELIETLRAMKTPVSVAYAETQTNENDIVFEQQQYLEAFLARLKAAGGPANIMLDNKFGVTRLWPEIPLSCLRASGARCSPPPTRGRRRFRVTKAPSAPASAVRRPAGVHQAADRPVRQSRACRRHRVASGRALRPDRRRHRRLTTASTPRSRVARPASRSTATTHSRRASKSTRR